MEHISNDQKELLNEINADGHVSYSEFQTIRDKADERFDAVVEELGLHSDLAAFQKSADVTVQLLKSAALEIKGAAISDLGKSISKDAVKAQLNYIRLAGDAFLDKI